MLQIDPRHQRALEVRDAAFRSGRKHVRESYVRSRRERFARWQQELDEHLRPSQRADGSWSPEYTWDPVSAAGGDLYATALSVMTLTAPFRHAR